MNNINRISFEEILEQNERRIYYHIFKLRIDDPHKEYYQEGLCAMWNAYETYKPDKGPMSTYFNFVIRNRLIDLLRKQKRLSIVNQQIIRLETSRIDNGNRLRKSGSSMPESDEIPVKDQELWSEVRSVLTAKQWRWLKLYIFMDMSINEVANNENISVEAVKSRGRQVRKKLNKKGFKEKLKKSMQA